MTSIADQSNDWTLESKLETEALVISHSRGVRNCSMNVVTSLSRVGGGISSSERRQAGEMEARRDALFAQAVFCQSLSGIAAGLQRVGGTQGARQRQL